jgi:hypothetical protein
MPSTDHDIHNPGTQSSDKGVHTEVIHPHRPREITRLRKIGRGEWPEGGGGERERAIDFFKPRRKERRRQLTSRHTNS